jgi:hypothetical protein
MSWYSAYYRGHKSKLIEKFLFNNRLALGMLQYSRFSIKGRWPEAEPYFKSDRIIQQMYVDAMKELGIIL